MDDHSSLVQAVECFNRGEYAKVREICGRHIPTPETLHLLAMTYKRESRFDLAEHYLREGSLLSPDNPMLIHSLALIYFEMGDSQSFSRYAILALRSDLGLKIAPRLFPMMKYLSLNQELAEIKTFLLLRYQTDAESLRLLAKVYFDIEVYGLASEIGERIIAIAPLDAGAYLTIALCHWHLSDWRQSLVYAEECLKIDPNLLQAQFLCAIIYLDHLGDIPRSEIILKRLLEMSPTSDEYQFAYSRLLLVKGNLQEGFKMYQAGARLASLPQHLPTEHWDDKLSNPAKALIFCDGGIGDSIQFVRYVAELAKSGLQVTLMTHPENRRLLEAQPYVHSVVDLDSRPSECENFARLFSLPSLLNTSLESIPSNVPYLFLPPEGGTIVGSMLPTQIDCAKLKVGLTWRAGKRPALRYPNRDCDIRFFDEILSLQEIQIYCLQKLVFEEERIFLSSYPNVIILSDQLGDMLDTAHVVSQLDLIVSVDTAVAHLAGALAKPVWILLRHAAEWRWLLSRNDSPWYPTAKLYRQNKPDDWREVMQRVAQDLVQEVRV